MEKDPLGPVAVLQEIAADPLIVGRVIDTMRHYRQLCVMDSAVVPDGDVARDCQLVTEMERVVHDDALVANVRAAVLAQLRQAAYADHWDADGGRLRAARVAIHTVYQFIRSTVDRAWLEQIIRQYTDDDDYEELGELVRGHTPFIPDRGALQQAIGVLVPRKCLESRASRQVSQIHDPSYFPGPSQ